MPSGKEAAMPVTATTSVTSKPPQSVVSTTAIRTDRRQHDKVKPDRTQQKCNVEDLSGAMAQA